jgi:hypothetical protein
MTNFEFLLVVAVICLGISQNYGLVTENIRSKGCKTCLQPKLTKQLPCTTDKRTHTRLFAELIASSSTSGSPSIGGKDGQNLRDRIEVFTYITLWYILSMGYNVYNKKALNSIKLPWFVATIQMVSPKYRKIRIIPIFRLILSICVL